MSFEYYIAGDWGTSNLRLYLCEYDVKNGTSKILEQQHGRGVSDLAKLGNTHFESEFFTLTSNWLNHYTISKAILSGMVGSNIGWHIANYSPCPTPAESIGQHSVDFTVRGLAISIVGGLECTNPLGQYDVLRGEELQLLGWRQQYPNEQGTRLIALPGTHNKWVLVEDGHIMTFMTTYTGELFNLLCEHSVLVNMGTSHSTASEKAFAAAVDLTQQNSEPELLQILFSTRAQQIQGSLPPQAAPDYLSGLILASDVRGALKQFAPYFAKDNSIAVTLIGEHALCARYSAILNHYDHADCTHHSPAEVAQHGYHALFKQLR